MGLLLHAALAACVLRCIASPCGACFLTGTSACPAPPVALPSPDEEFGFLKEQGFKGDALLGKVNALVGLLAAKLVSPS